MPKNCAWITVKYGQCIWIKSLGPKLCLVPESLCLKYSTFQVPESNPLYLNYALYLNSCAWNMVHVPESSPVYLNCALHLNPCALNTFQLPSTWTKSPVPKLCLVSESMYLKYDPCTWTMSPVSKLCLVPESLSLYTFQVPDQCTLYLNYALYLNQCIPEIRFKYLNQIPCT